MVTAGANFIVGNGAVILQGVGYATIAGGGAFMAVDAVLMQKRKPEQKHDYLEFLANRSSGRQRVDGTLTWYSGDGKVIGSWSALSGSRSLRPIPQGEWTISNYRVRNEDSFVLDGVGFSIDISPDPSFGRFSLRIHPDGGEPGTAGCIGLNGTYSNLSPFAEMMSSYLKLNNNMRLRVNYNLPMIQIYP